MSPPALCEKPRPRYGAGKRGGNQSGKPDKGNPATAHAAPQGRSDRARLAVALSSSRPLEPFRAPPLPPAFDPWQQPEQQPPPWMNRRKECDADRVLAILDSLPAPSAPEERGHA